MNGDIKNVIWWGAGVAVLWTLWKACRRWRLIVCGDLAGRCAEGRGDRTWLSSKRFDGDFRVEEDEARVTLDIAGFARIFLVRFWRRCLTGCYMLGVATNRSKRGLSGRYGVGQVGLRYPVFPEAQCNERPSATGEDGSLPPPDAEPVANEAFRG